MKPCARAGCRAEPQVGPGPGVATQPPGGPGTYSPPPGGGQDQLQPSLLVWSHTGEPCVAGTSLFCFEGRPGITPSPPSKLPAWGGVPAHHRPQPPRRASGELLCLQAQARHLPPSREASGSRLPAFSSSSGSAAARTEHHELSLPNTHQSRHSPSPGQEVGPQSFCTITFVEHKDKMFINGS